MDADEAQDRMQEIQRIMERATLFTLLPGTPAILGGLLVLVGCAVSYSLTRSLDFADILQLRPRTIRSPSAACGSLIGVIGVLLEVIFTSRAAAKQNLVPPDRPMRVAAFSLTPSVIVAMVLTVKFLIPVDPRPEEIQYIVPVWMMLYGTGVYTAGLFSIRPPRVLGLVFSPWALLPCCVSRQYGVVSAALSFGLFHIVFRALHPPQTKADGGLMSEPVKPADIDAVIHERVRLAIVAALAVSPQLSFNELKSMLDLTDGNLSAHSRTLEEAGYIVVEKSFRGRRPYTSMRLTPKGRKAFERYLETLRQIVDRGHKAAGDSS